MTQSLQDVARRAGVSSATVSRALRGLPSVKPETRDRVHRIAREMGYAISPSASNLATGKTRTIGLLTPWVNRWFFSNIIEGAEKGLRQRGLDALLYTFHETPFQPREKLDPQVLRRRVDGILVLGLQLDDEEVADLEALGVPLLFLGPGHAKYPTVGIDDYRAGIMIMDHFSALGHSKIGHIAGPDAFVYASSPSAGRFKAWSDCIQKRAPGGPEWARTALAQEASFDQESGRRATHKLLDAQPEITAIFAATDTLALGVMKAVQERGLRVGQDIAIAGIDDEEVAEFVGLSTVRQDPRAQGMLAARLLMDSLHGIPLDLTYQGEIEFVERESSGRNGVRTLR